MGKKRKKRNSNYKKHSTINDIYFNDNNPCNGTINYIIRQWAKKAPVSEIARRLFISTATVNKIIKSYHYDNDVHIKSKNPEDPEFNIECVIDYNSMYTGTICYLKGEYKLKKKPKSNPIMDYLYEHIDEIKHDYLKEDLTRIDLCVKYNVSEHYIGKFITQNKIYKNKIYMRTE